MPIKSPSSDEHQIVPEFESTQQTSRIEKLRFLTSRIIDNDARRNAEEHLKETEQRLGKLARIIAREETSYIDRNLKAEPTFQPTPDGDASSYSDRVKELQQHFHERPETAQLRDQIECDQEKVLSEAEQAVSQQHAYERDKKISRDEFFKMRSGPQISDAFNRRPPR